MCGRDGGGEEGEVVEGLKRGGGGMEEGEHADLWDFFRLCISFNRLRKNIVQKNHLLAVQ